MALALSLSLLTVGPVAAQDLGPNIRKLKDGIFEDMEQYYALLVDRVGKMVKAGKTLDEIKKELQMPEYDQWMTRNRIPANIEAAYNAVLGRLVFKDH